MNLRRTIRNVILVALVISGALLGWEVVKVDDGSGNWRRIETRFRFAWEPVISASERTDLQTYAGVSITRWYCYGLSFAHSEFRFPKSMP
jgi:hypothetical protein